MERPREQILCLNFNADRSFLAVGTSRGFKIFSLDPFELRQHRDFASRTVLLEMIGRSNLIAIVSENARNKLRIYDDSNLCVYEEQRQNVAESTFKTDICSIRIRQRKVCVALVNKVFVLNFSTLDVEHVFETADNEDGLLSINNEPSNLIMAIPGKIAGEAVLCNFEHRTETSIKAHKSTLSLLEISNGGHKLATASEKGIKIRIYNTRNGQMIQQLRRGNEFATVYCVTFDMAGLWLSVSSDSCNVHIFALKLTEEEVPQPIMEKSEKYELSTALVQKQNPKSKLYFMRNLIPYFDNDHSFSCYKIPNFETEMVIKVAFGRQTNTLIVATTFGGVYYSQFDTQSPGSCKQLKEFDIHSKFLPNS